MRLYVSRIGTRIGGTVLGLGFLAIGVLSASFSGAAPDATVADRTFWMGVTFLIAGVAAVSVSWLVSDLSNVWCRPPPRIFRTRGTPRR